MSPLDVYKIFYHNCDAFYIEQTKRQVGIRIKRT